MTCRLGRCARRSRTSAASSPSSSVGWDAQARAPRILARMRLRTRHVRPLLALLAGASVLVASTAPAARARRRARTPSRPQVRILGFTTYPRVGVPQVQAKPGKKITACYEGYNGQREVSFVWRGWGIARGTKMGIALWGGDSSSPFQTEPTNAEAMRDNGFKWAHKKSEKVRTPYGYTFAGGPFGPQSIDGTWTAKILIKGKVKVRAKVEIACA